MYTALHRNGHGFCLGSLSRIDISLMTWLMCSIYTNPPAIGQRYKASFLLNRQWTIHIQKDCFYPGFFWFLARRSWVLHRI